MVVVVTMAVPLIPALRRQGQEDTESQDSQGYSETLLGKKTKAVCFSYPLPNKPEIPVIH